MHTSRLHGFTLMEVMITVSIASILGALAVPSIGGLANAYRSRETARSVMLAFGNARAFSQQQNEAVRVTVMPGRVEVARPTYSAIVATIHYVDGWHTDHVTQLSDVAFTSVPTVQNASTAPSAAASFIFCPTGDATYVTTAQQTPLCPLGDMMSNGGRIRFTIYNQAYSIELGAALAHMRLRTGS